MKIAVCQIFSLDGDREGNVVRIENALREANQFLTVAKQCYSLDPPD